MKVLMINVVCGIRSTGRICTDLAAELRKAGHEVWIAYGREKVPQIYQDYTYRIGSDRDVFFHGMQARLFDWCGFGSRTATEKFINWVQEYDPDVIHLHNLHGYYINLEVLFNYLQNCNKKIIWTLHDCWPFTGHAAYCEASSCEKWQIGKGCNHCPKRHDYPASIIDRSARNWVKKRKLLQGIMNLQIVTPSEWLAKLVCESFLQEYPVTVIHNGIDTEVFKPTASNLRSVFRLENKKVILGVGAVWEKRKGLDDFLALADLLSEKYKIVLIGLSKEQRKKLSERIIGIGQTNSQEQLAQYYTMADVFLNPTYEDNYPTTQLEAIACGTPVIAYDTGGCGESAKWFGNTVEKGNIQGLFGEIEESYHYSCTISPEILDKKRMLAAYLKLYQIK